MRCEHCGSLPCKFHEQREKLHGENTEPAKMKHEDVWWSEINKHRINISSGEDAILEEAEQA